MADIDRVLYEIEILKSRLSGLIEGKGNLFDPEVIKASILLDSVLDEYYIMHGGYLDEGT